MQSCQAEALVIFCDETEIPWLRFLRRGFRHVFIAVSVPGGWVTIDPLCTVLDVRMHQPMSARALTRWFERRGLIVLPARLRQPVAPVGTMGLWRPFTCVEAVKRALGVHAWRVITPYQLYRHLGGAVHPPSPARSRRLSLKEKLMARLISPPKPRVPAQAPAVPPTAVILTAATPATRPAMPSMNGNAGEAAIDAATQAAAERNLLRRAAGRSGSVLTGWRGILAPGAFAPARKRLLGG
jgi:hypothetical protein